LFIYTKIDKLIIGDYGRRNSQLRHSNQKNYWSKEKFVLLL